AGSGYLTEILPGVLVLAVGLATFGAPLTAATLGAAGHDEQGIASGVNNTVGQMGGLMMIAILPAAAGLSGATFEGPAFADGYETAMRICAVLALASAVVAVASIRSTEAKASNRLPEDLGPY
ncbi:MAG: MFS transporter, partial [Acidimicrobiales bacterium]|nr:MFS transporter [Acidimicrobiales bacterium]